MLREYLSSIANKFRDVLGTTKPINAQDFVDMIEETHRHSWSDGMGTGYNQGLEEGTEQGKQAEYDEFWDKFQDNGKKTDYSHAFSESKYNFWSNGINPKYPITPTILDYGFYGFSSERNGVSGYPKQILDFAEFCSNNKIDLSQCGSMRYAFYGSEITKMPPFKANNLYYTFHGCSSLKIIEDIGTTSSGNIFVGQVTNAFALCSSLKEIRFSCIINVGFNFSYCTKLSYESLTNIKDQLKDNSGSTSKRTITFGDTNLAKFTADDLAEIEAKGWTVK